MRVISGRLSPFAMAMAVLIALQPVSSIQANGIGTVYVGSEIASSISVIDTTSKTVVEVIPLDQPPLDLAFSPDAHFVYVSHPNSNLISVVDTTVEDVTATIKVGTRVAQIALTSGGAWLLVPDPAEGVLRVVDTGSRTELFGIRVGGAPETVAALPDASGAFVGDVNAGQISVVDLRKRSIVRTVQAGGASLHLTTSPTGQEIAAAGNRNELLVLDATSGLVRNTIPGGPASGEAAFSPMGDILYLPRAGSNELLALNSSDSTSISLSGQPSGLAVSRDGTAAYIALKERNVVAVVDLSTRKVSAEIPVEKGPTRVIVSPLQPKSDKISIPAALPNTGNIDPAFYLWAAALGLLLLALGGAARLAVALAHRR